MSGTSSHDAYWPLRFISVEAASGVVLLIAAAVALLWANSPLGFTYEALWHLKLPVALGTLLPVQDLHFWVNDGLMTVFFLVVGLEVRREMHDGSLSDPRVATLPIVAAIGGVLVPALLYLAPQHGCRRRAGAGPSRPPPTSPLPWACSRSSAAACPRHCACCC